MVHTYHARSPLEAAQGSLLGLACGEAAVGVFEFGRAVSVDHAAWATAIPGGGEARQQRNLVRLTQKKFEYPAHHCCTLQGPGGSDEGSLQMTLNLP